VTGNRWLEQNVSRGASYDDRFTRMEQSGKNVHGEADLVMWLLGRSEGSDTPAVLDAGCGTGRVAMELARRGVDVAGVDLDPVMLTAARTKAPALPWAEADLADPALDLGRRFDLVVAAGNVMIFLAPGTEAAVVAGLARHLVPGGVLVAGFQLPPNGGLPLASYDTCCDSAGLVLVDRWSTWDRRPWPGQSVYAVSVHRRR
jgi:SAM-dependent methyltransferase